MQIVQLYSSVKNAFIDYNYHYRYKQKQYKGERMNIGQKLRNAREIKGLTQVDVARELGVTQGAVRQWEVGATTPSAGKLAKVAALLDIPVVELLGQSPGTQVTAGRDATVAVGHGATATNGGDTANLIEQLIAKVDALAADHADIKALLIKLAAR